MTKTGPGVFFFELLFHGQPEQQCSQPQGNFVGQGLNLEMGWNLWWAVGAKKLGEFLVWLIVIAWERVRNHVVLSSEKLAVFSDACGHVAHCVHPCCL
jgi:hypothetical protein